MAGGLKVDWSRVKTILIVGFALLNAMLAWQVYMVPDPRQPPQFLAEPTLEQVAAELATIGWELGGNEIPPAPVDLPLLAAKPRGPGDPAALAAQFFGGTPPASQLWHGDQGLLYSDGGQALVLAPGLLQLTANLPRNSPAADTAAVGQPCPSGPRALTGRGAAIDTLVETGRDFVDAHGGLPADVARRGDPFPRQEAIRLWFPQMLPGGTLILNGYVEVCMTEAGVTRYTRLLWDMGELLDQGGAVMPAAILLSREVRPGGSLSWAAADSPDRQIEIQVGYTVVPYTQLPSRPLNSTEGAPPAYVAIPVWRVQWGPDQWIDYDVITGKRLDYPRSEETGP